MRLAIFNGGMRKGKNTDLVLKKALDGMVRGFEKNGYTVKYVEPEDVVSSGENDTKVLYIVRYDLRNMKVYPCTGCMGCNKDGNCVMRDDMKAVYDEYDEADILIFASPIYFNSITAVMKSMIDRCQIYWARRFVLKIPKTKKRKKGIMLLTAGSELKEIEAHGSRQIFDIFFKAIDSDFAKETIIKGTDRRDLSEREDELSELCEEYENFVQDILND